MSIGISYNQAKKDLALMFLYIPEHETIIKYMEIKNIKDFKRGY